MQLRIDLLWWQELSEDVPVRAGAKIANTSEESKRGRSIRDRKTTVFKLLKQVFALFEFLRVLQTHHKSSLTKIAPLSRGSEGGNV